MRMCFVYLSSGPPYWHQVSANYSTDFNHLLFDKLAVSVSRTTIYIFCACFAVILGPIYLD